MSYPREEVQAAVDRYHRLRDQVEAGDCDFGVLADLYTDDAVYVDAAWGRIEGRDAIGRWLVDSMVGLGSWQFPVEFTAIDGDNVVVKWTQVIPGARDDGTGYTQSGYSRLIYAGDGRFRYEEDVYNMVHVLDDIAASGWQPDVPMNLPPANPDRRWMP